MSDPPKSLSVSLAEELSTLPFMNHVVQGMFIEQAPAIIQRRVEPLERAAEAAARFASITDPMCYCFSDHICTRCEARKNLKQALARIKEGR